MDSRNETTSNIPAIREEVRNQPALILVQRFPAAEAKRVGSGTEEESPIASAQHARRASPFTRGVADT